MNENDEKQGLALLETLYELARADISATPAMLARCLEAPETHVQELLARLDAQGLLDQVRCRLSMQGLVLAVRMGGAQKLSRHALAA